jgi:prepilin-type N-terminal cleavage/methylation domain-containing protein
MRKLTKKAGFSLVEIMIAVAILGLLLMVAFPAYSRARKSSQSEACHYNQRLIFEQMNIYCLEHNHPCNSDVFPNLCAVRSALVPSGPGKYIKKRTVFSCPANPNKENQHDYRLARNGREITEVQCDIIPDHNDW